jgi:hypothetical protein
MREGGWVGWRLAGWLAGWPQAQAEVQALRAENAELRRQLAEARQTAGGGGGGVQGGAKFPPEYFSQ